MQETYIQSLGWEVPLEEETATQFHNIDGKISWTEEPGGLQPIALQTVGHN